MTGQLAVMATRYAGRPILLLPRAAEELAHRIRAVDERAFSRPSRLGALMRTLSRPLAMDDDDGDSGTPPPAMHERLAYMPLYIGDADDAGFCWTLKDGVALMCADTALTDRGEEYCGVAYHGYDTLLAGMREALADDRVKGLFLRLASPGGVVAGGLPALAEFMRANRALAGGKPIWVYADMACSAAYWIAAQADRILAPAVGMIGSIGAVLVHEDWSGYLEKNGIKVTPIQFGAKKTDGAPWSPLSPGASADIQAEIDQCGRDFVADVIAGRAQLTREAVLATEAACYMGRHDEAARSALDLKLVDEISSEEAAFAALVALIQPADSVQPGGNPALAGRTASLNKETTLMAVVAPKKSGANAARIAELQAELKRLDAKPAQPDPEDGNEPAEQPNEPADPEDENEPAEPKKDTPAAQIAASAEAKAEPALALNAIRTGQTLAQFQATVAALGTRPKTGALAEAMKHAPRLGADATPKPVAESLAPNAVYARRATSGAGRK